METSHVINLRFASVYLFELTSFIGDRGKNISLGLKARYLKTNYAVIGYYADIKQRAESPTLISIMQVCHLR
jgi:hypothetical protein